MANAVGGSIESVTIKGRSYSVAADSDSNMKLGGMMNEMQANGDGTARVIQTREPWTLSDIALSVDDAAGDHEFLQDIADVGELVPITIAFASGVVYQGTGTVTAEIPKSSQAQTVTCGLSGTGKLTPQ